MITKSNPFLRNDYYPDQNDIDELNTRINEVQSDVDLLAIAVNEKTEAVNGRLNTLQNDYNESFETDALKANTADLNVLNVNVQATIKDLDAEDTYTENLIVNKPVQDLALRNPHLENTTSLNGNFYEPRIIGGKLSGDVSGDLNVVNANQINAASAVIANLFINTKPKPVSSSAVLGYDSEGRVIPIHATYDAGLPENADYLWTNQTGIVFGGVKATEVGEVENLITAYGVKNAIDALNMGVTDNFNLVNDNLNNVYQWQNSFENSVANTFNEVNTNIENNVSTLNNRINNIELNFNTLVDTKQPKTLSAPITVGGISSTTVEDALGNLNALVDTKLPMVTLLPANPSNGEAVLYIGTASEGLKTGGIYQYQVSEWVLISYAESFTFNSDDFDIDIITSTVSLAPERRVYNGTKADWDTLSVVEKTQYGATAFTDDEGGDSVEDIPITLNTSSAYKVIELKAIRMGNVVNVVGIVEVLSQLESVVIATGFPPPFILQYTANSTQIYLEGQRSTNSDGQAVKIDKYGQLTIYTSNSGNNYYFSGSYIA